MDERTIEDAHGVALLTRWWPVADPRAVVLVSHGASEHSGRYDRFARALNDGGVAVAALDHRGHGYTGRSSGVGMMGPGGGDAVIDDLHELRVTAEVTFGDVVPTVLFGHSMGSLIAIAYLVRHSAGLAGSVLCGFPVDLDAAEELGVLLKGAADGGMRDKPFDAPANNAGFEPARTPFDWLSRDADEVDRYIADPFCGESNPLTYGYLAELFDVVAPAASQLGAIRCPLLVIAGDQDPAAGMGVSATKLADALQAAGRKVDLTLYKGARHELLNETNRDAITDDVVRWLRRLPIPSVTRSPPSGSAP